MPSRPLVEREDHRAVLDGDRDAAVLGVRHEPRPDPPEVPDAVRDALVAVPAHERAHDRDAQLVRRDDDALEMVVRGLPLARIRVVVGVVGERGDLEPVPVEHVADALYVELRDVDVTDPRVSPALAAHRGPARDLQHLEPVSGGPGRDLLQRESREGGGQESQLHGSTSVSTSTHRRSASDRATASPRTFPACPSSKVG